MKKKMRKFEVGGYTGDDEIVKYRMGMIDAKGNDLTKKSETIKPDTTKYVDESMGEFTTKENLDQPKAVEKTVVKTKVSPVKKSMGDDTINPDVKVRKPFIDIPKNVAGMQQYRSDAISPAERLFKSLTEIKSQRSKAAGLNSGGTVKSSASSRGDGIAMRGKTRGTIC